jgi:3-isopropylmalate/(R)-2-methylmalate dehydratase large subunit
MKERSEKVYFGGPKLRETEGGTVGFGGVLYLTADAERFKGQWNDANFRYAEEELLDDISTDQLIRVNDMLTDDMELVGKRALLGMEPKYEMEPGKLGDSQKTVVVAGERFGRGSSREQAVWTLWKSGVAGVIAKSFGPIFEKNCAYLGMLTSTDLKLAERIDRGEAVELEEFLKGKDEMTQEIIKSGGLFPYLQRINEGKVNIGREQQRESRPMNIWEKRLAQAAGVTSVSSGEAVLLPVDIAYSYAVLSGLARSAINENYGQIKHQLPSDRIFLFEDHFAHSHQPEVRELETNQRKFAGELQLPEENYFRGKKSEGGGKGICHRVMLENLDPRKDKVVVATDSHTPTIGVLPLLGIPVGSTMFGAAVAEGKIPTVVSGVVRVELSGKLPAGCHIRDAQLEMAAGFRPEGNASVVEFGGEAMENLSFDQVTALCNMVPEVFNGEIAVTEAFPAGVREMQARWEMTAAEATELYGKPDQKCEYTQVVKFDLDKVTPWVAKPGSPNRGTSLAGLTEHPQIQKAYLVSCTLGIEDMALAAAVLQDRQVAAGTDLIVVAGSEEIRRVLDEGGIWNILARAGAKIVEESACGPCIGAGLGPVGKGETAISASNRNFPGRMGDKDSQVYLGGSIVTALSAIYGHIPTADEYEAERERIEANIAKLGL